MNKTEAMPQLRAFGTAQSRKVYSRHRAEAVAPRIGTAGGDHAEAGCKTPAAAADIEKTFSQRAPRAAKQRK